MQGSIGPRESERTWRLLGSDCRKLANCRARLSADFRWRIGTNRQEFSEPSLHVLARPLRNRLPEAVYLCILSQAVPSRVIYSPGDGCAEQRQGGEQNKATYCFGVHFSRFRLASSKVVPIRKGQRLSRPFPLAQYEKTQLSGSARLVTLPRSVHRQRSHRRDKIFCPSGA